MANDCINKVNISHSDKALMDRFIKAYNEDSLFEEFLPVPPDHENSHEFRISNWGTVKDVYETTSVDYSNDETNEFYLEFSTAWTPPVAFFKFLHEELGFDVRLYYFEYNSFIGGSLINSEVNDYDLENVDSPESVYHVVEAFPEIEQDERYSFHEDMYEEEEEY